MNTILLTPYDRGDARDAGRKLWRKQLLPIGDITYKGRTISFTRDYLAGLARAFTDRAFDLVPFQLAPGDNSHTNDPERTRGAVERVELADDGLDVILTVTDEGDELLRKNPQLGVSARIVEDYGRADGKFYPRAIQHVLGTLDPRITGMRPWQSVEAANGNDDASLLDLTAQHYDLPDSKETGMAFTADQEARLAKLLDLPDDKFDALLAPAADEGATGEDELSDEELKQLLDALGSEGDNATEDDGDEDEDGSDDAGEGKVLADAGAALSAEARAQIDLANARADENETALATMRSRLDAAAYEKERDYLARECGIPPRITDMARPLLEGDGHVLDLANGKNADAGEIVRTVFKEFSRTMRLLELGEIGSAEGAELSSTDEADAEHRNQLVSQFRSMTGI